MCAAAAIRRATADDAEEVIRLRIAFLREYGEAEGRPFPAALESATREYVRRTLSTGDLRFWFAEADGAVAGCCALILFDRPPSYGNPAGLTADLLNVYTVPPYRRRGIASRLIEEALQHAKSIGAGRVSLHTSSAGRAVYDTRGSGSRAATTRWTFACDFRLTAPAAWRAREAVL